VQEKFSGGFAQAPVQKERLDINQAILEVVALTRSEVQRNGIALQTELQSGLPPVLGDRIQLQQVMLNFILNAVEAMSGVDQYRRNMVISTAQDSNGEIVAVRDTAPTTCFSRSIRPRRPAWAWDCRSAVRSSKRMAGG
jgi:C4-dicarboxylate-specific signal transduction histidine kinase